MSERSEHRYREWLVEGLRTTGKSQSGLARHMGVSQSAANRWANGKTRLKAEDLPRIADFLGIPLPNLGSVAPVTLAQPTFAEVPIKGFVMEGFWIEANEMRSRQPSVAVVPNPNFDLASHYALETGVTPSDDPDIARKTYLCIKIDALDRSLRPKDRVHLQARRGGVLQSTIRFVARRGESLVVSVHPNGEGDPLPLVPEQVVGIVVGVNIEYRI